MANNELNDLQRLAIATALEGQIKRLTSTRGDTLRTQVAARLLEDYQDEGIDRRTIRINGQQVATASVVAPKADAKPAPRVVDGLAYAANFTDEDVLVWLAEWVCSDSKLADAFAQYALQQEGILLDGCELQQSAGRAPYVKIVADAAAIVEAMQGTLPATVAGLLSDGQEEN